MARPPHRPDPAQLSLFVAQEPTASTAMRSDEVAFDAPATAAKPDPLAAAVFLHFGQKGLRCGWIPQQQDSLG